MRRGTEEEKKIMRDRQAEGIYDMGLKTGKRKLLNRRHCLVLNWNYLTSIAKRHVFQQKEGERGERIELNKKEQTRW